MIVRAAVAATLLSLGLVGCSGRGADAPPSSSIPVTVGPADAKRAAAIALASPYLTRIAGSTPYSVVQTAPGSAGTIPDKFMIAVIVKFARPVRFPAGIPVMLPRNEAGSPTPPLESAVTTSVDHGQVVDAVTALVDVDAGTVFSFQPGGLP